MNQISVFTATYNRAHLLPRLFDSLCNQTVKDFTWLIIDDGSTDGTESLVKSWQEDSLKKFTIEYYKKPNGGIHTAFNLAVEKCSTELFVTVDSDDALVNTALEDILKLWAESSNENIAGIVGLDINMVSGEVLGDNLPEASSFNMIDLFLGKYQIRNADRTIVMRTDLYKKYGPVKEFEGEKFNTPHTVELEINKHFDMLPLNKPLKLVEYQQGGLSDSLYKLYKNNPRGFAVTRKSYLSLPHTSVKFKLKQGIHLVSSGVFASDFGVFSGANPCIIAICFIPGLVLSLIIDKKCKK